MPTIIGALTIAVLLVFLGWFFLRIINKSLKNNNYGEPENSDSAQVSQKTVIDD